MGWVMVRVRTCVRVVVMVGVRVGMVLGSG